MSTIHVILIVLAAVAVTLFLSFAAFPWAIKKGIALSPFFVRTVTTLDDIQDVIKSIKAIVPTTPALNITELIVKYAKEAVSAAEQLYKNAQLEADQRKAEAIKVTYECLELAGIELTEPVEELVNKLIEGAVNQLPKTHPGTTKKKPAV